MADMPGCGGKKDQQRSGVRACSCHQVATFFLDPVHRQYSVAVNAVSVANGSSKPGLGSDSGPAGVLDRILDLDRKQRLSGWRVAFSDSVHLESDCSQLR